jgi:glutamyl-tRNA reductase
MNLVAIGISHRTASVEVRERMWFSADEVRSVLAQVQERFFSESVLVSTCNRTELYGVARTPGLTDHGLRQFLIEVKGGGAGVRADHFTGYLGGGAVNHLFKVASGIESLVVGDIQILNQVKEAFQISHDVQASGPVMRRLMQATLHVGKRVRTETAIGEGAVSVSYAAVELANKIFADLSRKTALLIGAGDTGELTLKHLTSKGIGRVLIANRTREKAEHLVTQFGGTVADFSDLAEAVRQADIVITSVSSPEYVLTTDKLHAVMRKRSNNPLFLIDIGVPRNIDPSARKIENIFLYDIDSLTAIVDKNLEKRRAEIPHVTRIIREELVDFFHWYNAQEVTPTVHAFRSSLEAIRAGEVEKNIHRFVPEDRELVDLVTKRIVNKILHTPTTVLKQGAENGSRGAETMTRVHVLRELFGLLTAPKERHDD